MVEKQLLKPLECINWLARNKHGQLCGYDRLPTKSDTMWMPEEGHSFAMLPSTPKHDYIQWQDEYPHFVSSITIKPNKEEK